MYHGTIATAAHAHICYAISDSARTEALYMVLKVWTMVLGIDLIITINYFIWPKGTKI